jgi:hypothetical protein
MRALRLLFRHAPFSITSLQSNCRRRNSSLQTSGGVARARHQIAAAGSDQLVIFNS